MTAYDVDFFLNPNWYSYKTLFSPEIGQLRIAYINFSIILSKYLASK